MDGDHHRTRRHAASDTNASGQWAEALAARYLSENGLCVLERNFRRRIGELDLVCRDTLAACFVIVEVRYRADGRYGGALVSIDRRKQQRLCRTARAWLANHAIAGAPARIDILAIEGEWQTRSGRTLPGEPDVTCFEGQQVIWVKNAIECER